MSAVRGDCYDLVTPMTATVLHCHPRDTSYSAALCQTVCDVLESHGVDYTLVGLDRGETADRARLARTDRLIVVYPTWWGGLPARLLDWVQQTLGPAIDGPGVGAEPDAPSSVLARVLDLTVVASHGSSWLKNTVQGEPGRKLWERSIVPLCAPGATFRWVALYDLDRLDRAGLERFIEKVRTTVTGAVATRGLTSSAEPAGFGPFRRWLRRYRRSRPAATRT